MLRTYEAGYENPRKKWTGKNASYWKKFVPWQERFAEKIDKTSSPIGCWLWQSTILRDGYGQMIINGKHNAAHRLSYELYKGPIPQGMHVLHRCDVYACLNPDHLFLGTHQDNMNDKIAKGRAGVPFGENHPRAKLKTTQVLEIRRKSASGTSHAELSREFGVSTSAIEAICKRRTWRSI